MPKTPMAIATLAMLAVTLIAVATLTSACEPRRPTLEQAQQDIANMEFVRHANGLCFGVVRFTTYSGYQGVSVTQVASEACGQIRSER